MPRQIIRPYRLAAAPGNILSRVARPVAALVMLTALASCSIPGPTTRTDQIADLRAMSYVVGPPLDIRIFAQMAGDPEGRRVIFVHGTPGQSGAWSDYLANVPKGFEFVAIDRAGFGKSTPGGALPSLKDQARTLLPLLVKRKGGWPILVGHSLGGPIIAQAAADYPDKVGGLVIAAGSLDPDLESVQMIQYVGEKLGLTYLIPRRMRNANRELIALKKYLVALEPRLKSIHCPVAIVHGTVDTLVPFSNVSFMRVRMRRAIVKVFALAGVNHFLPWNSKPVIDEAVETVATLPGRSCG